jgi:hypothetical protein
LGRPAAAQELRTLQQGRFTIVAAERDQQLARSMLSNALVRDSFPGLPRPSANVLIQIAPDRRRFREWIGEAAPEWGAAIAVPSEHRIVMQGSSAGSDAGDPLKVLRHELAHLALHERMGDAPPRWFDEGYASFVAGEWDRESVLATNLALALRGMPTLEELEGGFYSSASRAEAAYALAHRAVAEMAAMDPERGLALFFQRWREQGSLDVALRQAYGITEAAFEQRWRDRTRRRYGGLALFADVTIAALALFVIVMPLYIIRRRRDRRKLEAMIAADTAAEQREKEMVIDELLRSVSAEPHSDGNDSEK